MKEIIAMHGWGSDSQSWKQWEEYFKKNGWLWQSMDRGYGSLPPTTAKWVSSKQKKFDSKSQRVIICHSLGAHLIEPNIYKTATEIVFLSSFGRFIPEDKESRAIKIALQGMQKALGSPLEEKMLIKFLEKSSSPYLIDQLTSGPISQTLSSSGSKNLQSDLDLLINTQGIPPGISSKSRVLTIFGEKDSILHPSSITLFINDLNNHLQHRPINWTIPGDGHSILIPGLIPRVEKWLKLSK